MKKNYLRNMLFLSILGLILMTAARASIPLWTFAPVTGYPTAINGISNETATIKYTVTNQSYKSHTLVMRPISGIIASGCSEVLFGGQSCSLVLTVIGSSLQGDVIGGPILCERASTSQCYQPSPPNSLAIHLLREPPIQQYTIVPSAEVNGTISPNVPTVVNAGATLTFTATPNTGYGVNQWLVDGNVVQTGGTTYQLVNITANHTVHVTWGTVTLTPSVQALALSINCLPASSCTTTQNAALTGNSRQITIQNMGSVSATNVAVSVDGSGFPAGTSISNNTCSGTLSAGASCTVTITPGSVASADVNTQACTIGTVPVATPITITADGGVSSQVGVYVLGYGCQYQGGFLLAVDDTTVSTGSISGKALTLVDQATPFLAGPQPGGVIWSSNGQGSGVANVSYDLIPGINESSTTSSGSPTYAAFVTFFTSSYTNPNPFTPASFAACNGNQDGQCNGNNILTFYNQFITNYNTGTASPGPTPLNYYAAGKCVGTINGYSDWYLPAICELDANVLVPCSSGIQSANGTLAFLIGNPLAPSPTTSCNPPALTECLAGQYWSSTERGASGLDQTFAWAKRFSSVSPTLLTAGKESPLGVRCVRFLTPTL